MSLKDTLKQAWEGAKASNLGEDAAHEWFRQGNTTPPGDNTIYSLASEIAPGHEEAFVEGFDECWDEGVEAQDMSALERFLRSKSRL